MNTDELKKVPFLDLYASRDGRIYFENKPLPIWKHPVNSDYLAIVFNQQWYFVHRLVYFAFNKEKTTPPFWTSVDHINREKKDNKESNLRILSPTLQNLNRNCKGYYFCSRRKKFRGRVGYDGKKYHIGYYKSAEKVSFLYQYCKQAMFNYIYDYELKNLVKCPFDKKLFKSILNEAKKTFETTIKPAVLNLLP